VGEQAKLKLARTPLDSAPAAKKVWLAIARHVDASAATAINVRLPITMDCPAIVGGPPMLSTG
jgi:hypothetical protein